MMTKKVINGGEKSKALNEVKPVKNKSKHPQVFFEISPAKKEGLHSNKPQDHRYE